MLKVVIPGVMILMAAVFAGVGGEDVLKRADRAFEEQTFSEALVLYQEALGLAEFQGEADRVRRRIGICLARLDRFDEARTALEEAVPLCKTDRERARTLTEAGLVALTMPSHYYEKDGKKLWGRWVQGATYHWVGPQLLAAGVQELDRGRRLYAELLGGAGKPEDALAAEHLRCHLELAAGIEAYRDQVGNDVADVQIVSDDPYGSSRTWNERMAFVFDQAIAAQKESGRTSGQVLAGYMKAMAFRRVLERVVGVRRESGGAWVVTPTGRATFALPDGWSPLKILEETWIVARRDPLGDIVLSALARIQENWELFTDAVASWKKLIETYPKSRLVADGKAALERITGPRLVLESGVTVAPGQTPEVALTTRNLAEVTIRVFRFPLADLVSRDSVMKDTDLDPQSVEAWVKAAGSPHRGEVVATLVHRTKDDGQHFSWSESVRLPVSEKGCYLIEASGAQVVYRDFLVISDVALLNQTDGDKTLVYAVDALSGTPLPGTQITLRHRYRVRGLLGQYWKVHLTEGLTDADGVFVSEHPGSDDGGGRYLTVHARRGEEQAFVPSVWYRRSGGSRVAHKAYVFTDRPVYRPDHTVHFAGVLRKEIDAALEAMAEETVTVEITDPKGSKVFDQAVTTDATGALDASLTLGAEPPLGVYRIGLRQGNDGIGRGTFRVEEYKKPEFLVEVAGPEGQRRLGDGVSATVSAQYYFGAPVVGAQVAFRVFRERARPRFRANEPYRELYGDIPENVDPSDRGGDRELVTQGQGLTDESGRLVIEWSTQSQRDAYPNEDSMFVVQADVTDASRRTISGASSIPVTRTALHVQVRSERGFWAQGEAATFEIQAQTPAGAPLATQGTVRVYRVTQEARGGDVHDVLTQVLEDAASTDERGVGFFRWFADAGGRFIVSYQVRDTWGELARGDAAVWVHGPTFTGDGFQMKNLEVITDRRVYEPGDVALVMVNCNFPGTSVLVSLVAGQSILRHEVVRMTGKTAVLSIPIEKEHVPNMHLIASAIRNGEAYSVQQEVLVPPVSQLLDVEVSFDKPTYRPGEQGKVVVKVRDHRGQPTPARVALTCLDASLFYIQQDQTLDIRRFFYGHRRGRDIRSGTSTVAAFRGYLARDFQWGDHKPSGWAPAWYNRPGLITRVMARRAFGPEDDLGESSELLFDSDFEGGDRKKLRSLGGVAADAAAPGGRSRNAEVAGAEMPSAEAPSESTGIGAIEAAHVVATPIPEEIRTDFRDAARWAPDVQCDAEGTGVVDIPFPESLTTWRAKAIAWTADTLVGTGTANAVTTKDVLVRLQAPRFFVEGDRLTLSALVDNRTQQDLSGQVTIELAGGSLRLQGDAQHSVKLKALGQARMDWVCDVIGSGEASVTVRVVTDADRDAMRMLIPVQPWGARKTLTETSVLTNGGGATFSLDIPSERREGDSELTVILQPSLALTLLDALPYLIEYPYGCTEQTMSRFIPAVACAQTLKEAGTSLEEIASGRKNLPRAADQGSREAMISDRQLRDIVGTGLNRIASMQQGDGGWGWWRRDGSSPSLTSYVLLGLGIAEDAGYTLPSGIKERGLDFLGGMTKDLENVHDAASIAWVLSRHGRSDADLLDRTFRARNELGVYGKALLCSALQLSALTDRAQVLVRNLADSVRTDPSNGTVHWDPSGPGWRWWDSPIETNAAVLQALLDVDPSNPWVPGLVKWLVRNRQGNHWSNTRDTALCVLALTRYARQAGELDPDYTVEVICAGDRKVFQVDRRNMFAFDNRFHLRGDAIPSGALPIEVRMTGRGRAYLTSSATFFTKEDHITGAGHELFIQRSFHRIEERAEDVVENGVKTRRVVESRTPLVQGADVRAGEIIEVKLALDAKNDYSHILIEDMKAAGFEPLQLRSGWNYEAGVCSNVEFRDERTAFFVTWLQQGTHELTYRLRAEVPGTLRALPARAESMYAPTFGGISDSFRVTVRDVEGL